MDRQFGWEREHKRFVYLLIAVFLVIVVRSAWVCDDAYITLRTVDNLYHGYGLTWNVGERVQTYTHPLWFLVLASTYFLSGNPYYLLLGLSILISGVVVILLCYQLALSTVHAILGILMLLASKAFIDYSTSGLENPLSHLLIILFIIIFLNQSPGKFWVLALTLTTSLGMMNRMDLALFFLPAIVYTIWERHTKQDILFAALGFAPFILWELFSLFYYGFLFPNTAYAKLNTGIPNSLLIKQGVFYLLNSISRDPATLSIMFAGVLTPILERNHRRLLLALGIVLYLLYVVRIGGDYMAGRFLSVGVAGAVALLASSRLLYQKQNLLVVVTAVVLLGLATPNPPLLYNAGDSREEIGPMGIYNGIEDGRLFNYQQTGILTINGDGPMPRMAWAYEGQEAKERGYKIVTRGPVGAFGFYAGPSVYVVDWYGIGDPLLARLPVDDPLNWRIGHFYRSIPEGYLETLESGSIAFRDPNLAAYYQKLSIVTRGKLLSFNRLVEMWKLNTGYYQPLLEAYETTINQ